MSNMPHPAVFISSTQRDLAEYRMAVRDTILSFDLFPIMMEYFPAMDADAVQACMDKVGESNLYLGIFAHRYGFCPEGRNISITELEFDHATKNSIPRLCFLIDEDAPWPHEHFEDESGMAKLKQFKAKIEAKLIRAKFSTPESLRVEVAKALHNHFDHRDTILSIGGHNVTNVTIPIANDSSTSDSSRVKVQIILNEQDVLNFDSTTFKNALSGMLGISPNEITIFRVTIGSLLVYIELPMDAGVQLYKLAFGESADHVLIQDGQLLSVSDLPVFSQPAILGDKQSFRLAQNPMGNRSENLEQAIAAYQQALTVTTKSNSPADWATTMMNLGNAYAVRIQGDKAENIEKAIDAYNQALSILPKEGNEQLWAALQSALGTALKQTYHKNWVENIEKAIDAYNQALTVQTPHTVPAEWAATMSSLGNAYRDRIRGIRAENIGKAIDAYKQALTVRKQDTMPVEWAQTMMNLGNAYAVRIQGGKAWVENIETAIATYEQALTIQTKSAMPVEWAQTMMNLGDAYRNRSKGNKSENIEAAIQALGQARPVMEQNAMHVDWAATMNNLGNACVERIQGDKAKNIEAAINAYKHALTVRTKSAMPVEWAQTMMNLGNAYAVRIQGDKAENIEVAIVAYKQALEVRTKDTMPVAWAITMMNLGNAYRNRIKRNKAENIEVAIQALGQARLVMEQNVMRVDWAIITNNLGNAYAVRIEGGKPENIEKAIDAYNQALTIRTKDTMPVEWAQTMMNVGNAYAVRIKGDKGENIEQAIAAYNQALTVRKQDTMPAEHRDTLKNFAQLYIGEKRWSEAHQTCLDAIDVGEDIFAVAVGDAGRMDTIGVMGQLYIWAAYSALQSGNYDAALEQLEASKAQLLAEAQSLGDANLTQLTEEERGQLQARRERIRNLEYEYRLPTGNLAHHDVRAISQELGDKRAELRELVDQFSKKYPDFMPKGLSLVDLLALIPKDGALVAPLFTSQGSAVFVVPGGVREVTAEHVLMLDDFTLDDLNAITRGVEDSPGWLHYYVDYRFRSAGTQRLFDGIEDVTQRLWDAFVGTIHRRLQALGVQRVVLMPQGDTNLLPLHAAWREIDGVRRYFMDDYAITYTPSMAALANAQRKTDKGIGALIAGVSQYAHLTPLPNARAEAKGVAALFSSEALLDEQVSVEAVRSLSAGKAYVHLSCHGSFGWSGDAFASALYLGNDEVLPLPEIIAHLDLHQARLVVLSACETGIVDVRAAPDEFVGLPAGFMQAGASAVVSSLWTVDDHSTALLMERFYHNHLTDGMEPAAALRAAQFWLRDASGDEIVRVLRSTTRGANENIEQNFDSVSSVRLYSNPYYWAAFTFNGI